MKKIMKLLLTVVIAFTTILAIDQFEVKATYATIKTSDYDPKDVFTYTTSSSSEVTITAFNKTWYEGVAGSASTNAYVELTIPDEIDGKKVVAIASYAFPYNGYVVGWSGAWQPYIITKVDMSNAASLKTIGANAFQSQSSMTTLSMSNSVTTIGASAFRSTGLQEVILSDNITSIGADAFYGDNVVKYMIVNGGNSSSGFELPSKIETIGANAFRFKFDSSITELSFVIPDTVTSVGNLAFYFNAHDPMKKVTITNMAVGATYTSTSFNMSGTISTATANNTIIFADEAEYTRVASISSTNANIKSQFTYEVDLKTYDVDGTYLDTEKKIYNKSIKYVKDTTTNLWLYNDNYELPSLSNVTLSNGYMAKWLYQGTATKVDTSDVVSGSFINTSGEVSIQAGLFPIEPTVSGTVNGVITSTGDWGDLGFDLYVEDTYDNQTIGVDVYHPLLLSEEGSVATGYVEFKYAWKDLQMYAMSGSCFVSDGVRSYTYSEGFDTLSNMNEISIRSAQDLRNQKQVSSTCSGDEYYRVVVQGIYYDENGASTIFYQTGNAGIGGINSSNTTTSTVFNIQVYEYTPGVQITYDLNGGNINGDTTNVKWTDVETYSTLGDYDTTESPSPQYQDIEKDGYRLVGWKVEDEGILVYPDSMDDQAVTSTKTYKAIWEEIGDATVIFNYTGGIDLDNKLITVVSGKPDSSFSIPTVTKEGYVFDNWDVTPSKVFGSEGTTTIYTAQWKKIEYTVTFNQGDNGTLIDKTNNSVATLNEKVGSSDTITYTPSVTADTDYEFIGWKSSETGEIYSSEAVAKYNITSNVTFTAVYEEIKDATVIFDYNGGMDILFRHMSKVTGKPDTTYITPTPIRIGYTFDGWDVTPTGTFGAAGSMVTYTAKWKIIEYTVTFEKGANGILVDSGNVNVDKIEEDVEHKASATYVPTVTPDTKYEFIGWSKDGSNTLYTSDDIKDLEITKDTTFKAIYEEIADVTVVFNYNGGTDSNDDSMSMIVGKPKETYIEPTTTREGYTFKGWDATPTFVFGVAGTTTIYTAQWERNEHEVIFEKGTNGVLIDDSNSEITTVNEDVLHGAVVTYVPDVKENTDYTFIGWSVNGSTTLYTSDDIERMSIVEDTTIVAIYDEIGSATVLFNYDGGIDDAGESMKMIIGKPNTIYTPPTPQKEGYIFDGWDTTPTLIFGEAGSVVVYNAKWEKTSLSVTFKQGSNGVLIDDTNTEVASIVESVKHNDTVTSIPNVKANEDTTFIGWSMDGSNAIYTTEEVKDMKITKNTEFIAMYKAVENATVIFIYDGGTDSNDKYSSYASGKPATSYAVPKVSREGYTFEGWDEEPTKLFGNSGSVVVYTATWSNNELLVTFEQGENGVLIDNSSNEVASVSEQIKFNDSVSYVTDVNANEDYEFIGWSMNGKTSIYSSEDIEEMRIQEETIFTALYATDEVCVIIPETGEPDDSITIDNPSDSGTTDGDNNNGTSKPNIAATQPNDSSSTVTKPSKAVDTSDNSNTTNYIILLLSTLFVIVEVKRYYNRS